ncbi:MAG: hypothetical protein ABI831_22635 [Betaproteobacteria bacterium]
MHELFRAAARVLLGCSFCGVAAAQSAAPAQVAYYLGEVRMSSPAGQLLGASVSLVRRTLLPAENRVIEVVASIDPVKPVREYTTVFAVNGSRFAMKDEEGTFTGEGEFSGKPWEWTGWKYEVAFTGQSKGRLQGEDVVSATGLSVKKSFSSADGVVRMLFTEELKPVTKAVYDVLRARLVADKK